MTRTEDRLADALLAVTSSVRPETLLPLGEGRGHVIGTGRPPRRGRWLAPVAAAAAVVVIAAFGAVLATRMTGTGTGTGTGLAASPPAPIPYYVTVDEYPLQVVVRSTATGTVTARLPAPVPGTGPGTVVAAADRTFFIDYRPGSEASDRIYRFHVTAFGRISGLAPVPGGVLSGVTNTGMAVSPDGSRLAVAALPANASCATFFGANEIIIINTRTGARTVWRGGTGMAGQNAFAIASLSWTGSDHELTYLGEWAHFRRMSRTGSGCSYSPQEGTVQEVRAIFPAGHGGTLDSGRLLLRQPGDVMQSAMISPDGSAITAIAINNGIAARMSVIRFSVVTGRQRVIYQASNANDFLLRYAGFDPSGRYLLLDVTPGNGAANGTAVSGWIDHGRLVRLKPDGSDLFSGAW